MGGGTWVAQAFSDYTVLTKNCSVTDLKTDTRSAQDFYKSIDIHPDLNPMLKTRECLDTNEHPNTVPVILALDCTGSMGASATEAAKKLNDIMTAIYSDENCKDIEFCVMGIGDCAYDRAPIQISQFESDIRIAEHMDKIYFEGHGGGNSYESYTAAWYMGTHRCKLDCWKRGKKGIIITLGDELPNPYLPARTFQFIGEMNKQTDGTQVETVALLEETKEKFNIYHISVDDPNSSYRSHNKYYHVDDAWKKLIGEDNYFVATLNTLQKVISDIVIQNCNDDVVTFSNSAEVSW